MATNIKNISVGSALIQSGNGVPTHSAKKGSFFIDIDSGIIYINKDSSTTWVINTDSETGSSTFLPLSGGTINGNLTVSDNTILNNNLTVSGNTILNGITGTTVSGTSLNVNDVPYITKEMITTGLAEGGFISTASTTTFNINDGNGYIVNSHDNPENAAVTAVTWTGLSGVSVTDIATRHETFIMIDSSGGVVQLASPPSGKQKRENIYLGGLINETDTSSIAVVLNFPDIINSIGQTLNDLMDAGVGIFVENGLLLSADAAANLELNLSNGTLFGKGLNWHNDKANPNQRVITTQDPLQFFMIDSEGDIIYNNITDVVPDEYEASAGGIISTIPGSTNRATIQRVYLLLGGEVVIQFGQEFYNTISDAINVINIDNAAHVVADVARDYGIFLGYIIPRKGATDLTLDTDALIINEDSNGNRSVSENPATDTNIYNNDGTIDESRTVRLENKTLTFTSGTTIFTGEVQISGDTTVGTISADTIYSGGTLLSDLLGGGGSSRTSSAITTTDGSQVIVDTIDDLTAEATHLIEVFITCKDQADVEYGSWKRTLSVSNLSSVATIRQENADFDVKSSGFTSTPISFSTDADKIDINVTGIASTTIQWDSAYEIITKSTN